MMRCNTNLKMINSLVAAFVLIKTTSCFHWMMIGLTNAPHF